jgi:hypothetical protein
MLIFSTFRNPNSAFHLFSSMLQADFQQSRHVLIIQGIINNLPVPAAFNQSQIFQAAQLMGYG